MAGVSAVAVGQAILKAIVAAAISYAISKVLEKPLSSPKTKLNDFASGMQVNTRSTQEPLKALYGKQKLGGNIVYATTLGNQNRELWIVMTLCEGEIEGIEEVEGVPQIFIDDKIYTEFGSNFTYTLYTGTSTQTADPDLVTATQYEDWPWNDNLRYTAYMVMKIIWDADLFPGGIPTIKAIVKGKKLYDYRTSSTAYSTNPCLALYDYLTNDEYGVNLDASKLGLSTSWTATANAVDTAGWTLNYALNVADMNAGDVINTILSHFRGSLQDFDGVKHLKTADLYSESSVMTITDSHIVQDESGKAAINISQPSRFDKPNSIRVKYIDVDMDYTVNDLMIGDNQGVIKEMSLEGCTDREMAGKLALSALERAQVDRTVSLTGKDECILLGPQDIITLNSSALGIENQLMRVISTTINESGLINLTSQYESYDIYDDVYNINPEDIYTCSLPDPAITSSIISPVVTEQTITDKGRTFQRLNITFTVSENEIWYKDCEVWITSSGTYSIPDNSEYKHQFNSSTSFTYGPVEIGQHVWIKLRTVNIWGTKQALSSAATLYKEVIGVSNTPPASLPYLYITSGDGSVALYSTKLSNPDIEIYEFRYGSQWTGAIFLSAKRSPSQELTMVKPGTFTFWANTKGTNGLYGSIPRSASATVVLPTGWSLYLDSFTEDYTTTAQGQVFSNVEHITYDSEDYLQCSHTVTSGIYDLSGTYTSREFDTGVTADLYYCYIDTDLLTVSAGTTWSGIFDNLTWEQAEADTKSWQELSELDDAPIYSAKIYYKAQSGDDWSIFNSGEVLSTVVTARYFKVELNITDPSPSINLIVGPMALKLYTR